MATFPGNPAMSALTGAEIIPGTQGGVDGRTTSQAIGDLFKGTKGAAIASASTVNLAAATGRTLHITGSTGPITSFGTAADGVEHVLIFDSAPTLTHNATSLILPTGANIVAAAGDTCIAVSEGGGNWRVTDYTRKSGAPLVPGGMTNPMTTAGDIITGGSSGTPQRLAVGAAGKVLGIAAGAPAYVGGESISEPVNALATSGTIAINCALGDYFTLAAAGNMTSFTFSNLPAAGTAQTLMIEIKQDATGSRIATFPSSFKWAGGSTGVLSTAANSVDVLALTTFDQGTTWRATLAKAFS